MPSDRSSLFSNRQKPTTRDTDTCRGGIVESLNLGPILTGIAEEMVGYDVLEGEKTVRGKSPYR